MISPIWPFEADKVHHYAYADNVLTKKECEDLVFFAKSMDPEEAFIGKDKKLKWPPKCVDNLVHQAWVRNHTITTDSG